MALSPQVPSDSQISLLIESKGYIDACLQEESAEYRQKELVGLAWELEELECVLV